MCIAVPVGEVVGVVLLGDISDVGVARAAARFGVIAGTFAGRPLQVGAHVGGVVIPRLGVSDIGVHHVHRHARVILEWIGVHALRAGAVRRLVVAISGTICLGADVVAHRARVGAALKPRFPRLGP